MQKPIVHSHVTGPPLFPPRAYFPRQSFKPSVHRAAATVAQQQNKRSSRKNRGKKLGHRGSQDSGSCRIGRKLSARRADTVLEADSPGTDDSQDLADGEAGDVALEQSSGSYDSPEASVSVSGSEDVDLDSIIAGAQFDQAAPPGQDWYSELDRQEQDGQMNEQAARSPEGEEEAIDEEDPNASYPERPHRSYALGELMDKAGIGLPEDFEQEDRDIRITGLQNNYEKVQPGDLFIYLSGLDGSVDFEVAVALAQGAAAIMSGEPFDVVKEEDEEVPVLLVPDSVKAQQIVGAAFYDKPSLRMNVVAVTGSAGKTTTSWLIRGIFDELDKSAGLMGTVEYGLDEFLMTEDGDLWQRDEPDITLTRESSTPNCLTPYFGKYEVPETMPDGLHMQKIMAGQAERGATDCVIECTAAGLTDGRMDEVDVNVAVFTNILADKVEEYGGNDAYMEAQSKLLSKLTDEKTQCLVMNLDDVYADQLLKMAPGVPNVTYSLISNTADVYAYKVNYNIWETVIDVQTPFGMVKIITTLIGRNNVYNVLAAIAAGLSMSIPLKDIVAGIEATEVVPGRTEFIDLNQNFQVLVDSANTPNSLLRLLDDVQRCGPRNILLVFGCEGEEDPATRPYMGEIAYHKSNTLFITNQNQRSEPPEQIVRDIVAGFPDEILDRNASKPWKGGFLQDAKRVSATVRPFLFEGQNWYRKYVVEDRYTAIRWAIATAQQRDIVVVAGKGNQDWTEAADGEGGFLRGWLDDRVECRNALSKLYMLNGIKNMDRTEIPFEPVGEREARWWEWGT